MSAAGRKARQPVDWSAMRGRLAAARRAMEQSETLSHDAVERVLEERAAALARREDTAGASLRVEIVEFTVSGERYALESTWIREVQPLRNLTPLADTPAYVRGIVNIRGQIMPVVDLARLFELPERGLGDLGRLLVLQSAAMEFGILAQSVAGTRMLDLSQLHESLPTLVGIRERYLKGVTADHLVVLDAPRLLADGAAGLRG